MAPDSVVVHYVPHDAKTHYHMFLSPFFSFIINCNITPENVAINNLLSLKLSMQVILSHWQEKELKKYLRNNYILCLESAGKWETRHSKFSYLLGSFPWLSSSRLILPQMFQIVTNTFAKVHLLWFRINIRVKIMWWEFISASWYSLSLHTPSFVMHYIVFKSLL